MSNIILRHMQSKSRSNEELIFNFISDKHNLLFDMST